MHYCDTVSDRSAFRLEPAGLRLASGLGRRRRILVLWRDMEGLDPEVERRFLKSQLDAMAMNGKTWDEFLINGNTPIPGVSSLDPLFKRLMMRGEGI